MKRTSILLGLFFLLYACNGTDNINRDIKANNSSGKEITTQTSEKKLFRIYSTAFENNSYIPSDYTCDGNNNEPEIYWENIPKNTKSLILVVNDPDAPSGNFIHWIMVNIPPYTRSVKEARITSRVRELENDFGKIGYGGPCPPSGIHRYIFHLYAMKTSGFNGTRNELFNFIEKNKIAETTLIGLYKRK